jgi:hypothetical protein
MIASPSIEPLDEEAESVETEIKVVGKSGQISLGKRFAGKTLRLERRRDGTVLLTAVAVVPETQLWTLAEPHRSQIARGLTWAAGTPPRESDPDALLKKAATKRAEPSRGRRP